MNKQRNRLLIVIDGGFIRQIQLDKDGRREWFLGRIGPDYIPDIPLISSFVSRNQGSLQLLEGYWVYRNNPNNLYGTWYNDEPMGNAGSFHKNEAKKLKNGDLLRICHEDKTVLMIFLDGFQTSSWKTCRLHNIGEGTPFFLSAEDMEVGWDVFSVDSDGHWYVKNKESQQEIFINHEKCKGICLLKNSDLIEIGNSLLIYMDNTLFYSTILREESVETESKNVWVRILLECCIGLLCVWTLLHLRNTILEHSTKDQKIEMKTEFVLLRDDPGISKNSGPNERMEENPYVLGNTAWKRKAILRISLVNSLDEIPDDAWDVSSEETGRAFAWVDGAMHLYIGADGIIRLPSDCTGFFAGYTNVKSIDFGNCVDTSDVICMQAMFLRCYHLEYIDLESFDTRQTTCMSHMFEKCKSLTSLDLESFDTSAVIDMTGMFSGCSSLETINLSSFNTKHVKSMSNIFSDCSELSLLDVRSFDTATVTDGSCMFLNCVSLQNLKFDPYRFRTGSMTSMDSMFAGCSSLRSLDVSHFDTSRTEDMDRMFYMDACLKELAYQNFDMSRVVTKKDMLTGTKWQ